MEPVKYKCDSNNLTGTFARSKILLTEKSTDGALVTTRPLSTERWDARSHKIGCYHYVTDAKKKRSLRSASAKRSVRLENSKPNPPVMRAETSNHSGVSKIFKSTKHGHNMDTRVNNQSFQCGTWLYRLFSVIKAHRYGALNILFDLDQLCLSPPMHICFYSTANNLNLFGWTKAFGKYFVKLKSLTPDKSGASGSTMHLAHLRMHFKPCFARK